MAASATATTVATAPARTEALQVAKSGDAGVSGLSGILTINKIFFLKKVTSILIKKIILPSKTNVGLIYFQSVN